MRSSTRGRKRGTVRGGRGDPGRRGGRIERGSQRGGPRGRRKIEHVPEKFEEAKQILESHRDQLPAWRKLPRKERSRVLNIYYQRNERMSCLSSSCTTELSTYQGMLYHLDRCSLSAEEITVPCELLESRTSTAEVSDHAWPSTSAGKPSVIKKRRQASLKATKIMKQASRGWATSSESEASGSQSEYAGSASATTDEDESAASSSVSSSREAVAKRDPSKPSREESRNALSSF